MATGFATTGADFVTPVVHLGEPIPRLEQGDRLTIAEFERRYEAMTEINKAELIEGVVHVPSPVRTEQHAEPDSNLAGWLFSYKVHTPGLLSPSNPTVRLDQDNEPQPDNVLMIHPDRGGNAKLDSKGYIEGAPELVAEIASSSVSIDLNDKLRVYRRNGVSEYLVWRVLDRAIDWFHLRDGQYLPLPIDEEGIICSQIFPGLWLNVPAMLAGKLDTVLRTLQQGLDTPEHENFATQLAKRR